MGFLAGQGLVQYGALYGPLDVAQGLALYVRNRDFGNWRESPFHTLLISTMHYNPTWETDEGVPGAVSYAPIWPRYIGSAQSRAGHCC